MMEIIQITKTAMSTYKAKANCFFAKLHLNNYLKITTSVLVCTMLILSFTTTVFANPLDATRGEEQFNSLVEFLATWIGRIGGVVAFVGVVQFALGVKSQNPDEKINGLKTLVAGIMVFAVAQAYAFFTNW